MNQQVLNVMCVCLYSLPLLPSMQIASLLHHIRSTLACLVVTYFSSLSQKRHDFQIKVTEHKMFYFFLIFCNIFHSKTDSVTYYHKCTPDITVKDKLLCQILMKLEPSRQVFQEKSSNIRFYENSS